MNTTDESSAKCLDIRKYPNRRYYDATHSKHLTLEDMRSLIRDGYDIKVTDSKTGADITAQVLTQIVLELETPKIDAFPVALLVQMIRTNDHFVKDFVEKYFNQAFSAYLHYQKQMEQHLRELHSKGGVFSPFTPWAQAMVNPFMPAFTPPDSPKPSASSAKSETRPGDQDARNVITELQQQVARLKKQVKEAQRKSPKR